MEATLLYGCKTWTLTNGFEKKLDGCYKRLLRATLGINWKEHVSNTVLYSGLPKISDVIGQRRLKFAGHCLKRSDEVVADLVLWEPSHGSVSRGRPKMKFVDRLARECGMEKEDLAGAMRDRSLWVGVVAATISRNNSMPP